MMCKNNSLCLWMRIRKDLFKSHTLISVKQLVHPGNALRKPVG